LDNTKPSKLEFVKFEENGWFFQIKFKFYFDNGIKKTEEHCTFSILKKDLSKLNEENFLNAFPNSFINGSIYFSNVSLFLFLKENNVYVIDCYKQIKQLIFEFYSTQFQSLKEEIVEVYGCSIGEFDKMSSTFEIYK
jgi:hypothetical protein